jgi:hypothetical protein
MNLLHSMKGVFVKGNQRRWLQAARAGWVVLVLGMIVLMIITITVQYRYITTPCQDCPTPGLTPLMQSGLNQVGLSPQTFALIYILEEIVFILIWCAIALLVFLHRPGGVMELLVAYMLATFGFAFVAPTELLPPSNQAWVSIAQALTGAAIMLLVLFFFVFPDGRFVPRWTWYLNLIFDVWIALSTPLRLWIASELQFVPYYLFMLFGVISQIYRYRHNPDALQRQQAKWVVWGISVAIIIFAFGNLVYFLSPVFYRNIFAQLVIGPLIYLVMSLIPVSIGIAIRRHRLWDIDVVIRKSLVYAILTAGLALVFIGSVVLLQPVFLTLTGETQSEAGNVISTLVIATLFMPLRKRIQETIDRRFYRQKYNAERTLAGLMPALQEAVDIEKMKENLMGVIDEAFQPAFSSIWLRQASRQERH